MRRAVILAGHFAQADGQQQLDRQDCAAALFARPACESAYGRPCAGAGEPAKGAGLSVPAYQPKSNGQPAQPASQPSYARPSRLSASDVASRNPGAAQAADLWRAQASTVLQRACDPWLRRGFILAAVGLHCRADRPLPGPGPAPTPGLGDKGYASLCRRLCGTVVTAACCCAVCAGAVPPPRPLGR